MGATMVEKMLARGAGVEEVRPGEVVTCRPDQIVQHDLQTTTAGMWYEPTRVDDPDKIVVIFDHAVPAPTIHNADGMARGRRFAERFGIRVIDVGQHGISHQVIAEQGLALPGELLICSDSHTCAGGAFNCAARGTPAAETLGAIVKGQVWFIVGETIRYAFEGALAPLVTGKDAFFHIASEYGGHSGRNVEFGGPALASLPLSERRTIATMCAEISAEFAVFEHDAVLDAYLADRAARPYTPVAPDADATYEAVRTVDLSSLEPYVMRPDFVPNNGLPVSQFDGGVRIDQAFVGSCANGKIEDLRLAAEVVRGHRIAAGVRFLVTPASQQTYLQAVREGIVETLLEAGAVVTNSTCGACYGGHMGVVGKGEVCITASTRNFKGRMGSPDARVYMGSPATVAASALAGEIVDPRLVLA